MKRIIKGRRDSLGAPMEPDEEMPAGYSWDDEPIYEGERVIVFDGDLIIDEPDQLTEYLRKNGERIELIHTD